MAPLAALVPRTYFLAVQGGHLSFCHGAQLCQTSHSTSLTKDMAQKGRLKSWALWSNRPSTELELGGLVSNWLRDPGPATESLWARGSPCLKGVAELYHLQGLSLLSGSQMRK